MANTLAFFLAKNGLVFLCFRHIAYIGQPADQRHTDGDRRDISEKAELPPFTSKMYLFVVVVVVVCMYMCMSEWVGVCVPCVRLCSKHILF